MRPCSRASAAYADSGLWASKCRSRSTGRPSGPRSLRMSRMLMKLSSGHPMPRSARPKAISSSPSSVMSQVHCASGVKSLTTGTKSMSGCWLSRRTICAWQLAISVSCWVLVKSIERFLVSVDRSGPFTKPKDRGGPRRNPIDAHRPTTTLRKASNGRDSRFGLARAGAGAGKVRRTSNIVGLAATEERKRSSHSGMPRDVVQFVCGKRGVCSVCRPRHEPCTEAT
jgi:hypothetical protein